MKLNMQVSILITTKKQLQPKYTVCTLLETAIVLRVSRFSGRAMYCLSSKLACNAADRPGIGDTHGVCPLELVWTD